MARSNKPPWPMSREWESAVIALSPVEHFLNWLDDRRDARAADEIETTQTELQIMHDLGYEPEQLRKL